MGVSGLSAKIGFGVYGLVNLKSLSERAGFFLFDCSLTEYSIAIKICIFGIWIMKNLTNKNL